MEMWSLSCPPPLDFWLGAENTALPKVTPFLLEDLEGTIWLVHFGNSEPQPGSG